MTDLSFTTSFTVDRTPHEVFAAINRVRDWWSADVEGGTDHLQGGTDQLGEEFTYRYTDVHYSKQKIVELVPDTRIVWHVLEARLAFTRDPAEWQGTDIVFAISQQADGTELRFTHAGLVPEVECFEACSNAWGFYVNGSLRNLITAGG